MRLSIRNHVLSAYGVSTVRLINNERIIGVVCEKRNEVITSGKTIMFNEKADIHLIVQRNDSEPAIPGSGRDVKVYSVPSDEPTPTTIPHEDLWCIGTVHANERSFAFYTLIENL